MSQIVVEKAYTTHKSLDTEVSRDKRLSFKARGIMFYLLSKPDDWTCHCFDLEKNSDVDGRKAIQSAMKELVEFGYAELKKHKKDDIKGFMGSYYKIFDRSKKPDYVKPVTKKQQKKLSQQKKLKNNPPC